MKRISLFFLTLVLMFSTGCAESSLFSNYRPIEQLKLVHTIGFDLHKDGLELSICGGEKDGQGLTRLSCSGKNISECLAKLQNYSEKTELYYAHTRYVIVGEDYARKGLGDIMQYLESSTQLRSDLPLFIVKNGSAKDLVLKSGGKDEGIHGVMEAVLRDCKQQGNGYPFTCGDIGSFSAEYGSALACALTVSKTKDIDPEAEDEDTTPIVSGYAVIDLGTLTGFLSEDAARGVNLLIGEQGTQPMTVEYSGQPVSLRITKVKTALEPVFGDAGTMTKLTLNLQTEASLEETEESGQIDRDKLNKAFSNTVEQWMNEILLTMRDTQCDFLGFGPRIAIAYPKQFTESPIPWREQLTDISYRTEVRCTVHHSENESKMKEGTP